MPPSKIQTDNVLDVFQRGLRQGAARLPFAPHKRYFYVEHPEEGWRVYLRSVGFLHPLCEAFDPRRFLVVKRAGADPAKASWEPPKGQMEAKDAGTAGAKRRTVLQLLRDNIQREVDEEAKVGRIKGLRHTGLVVQSVEPDFPPNTYFQYHVFQGLVHPVELSRAFAEFEWFAANPVEFDRQVADKREKDALGWYDEVAEGSKKKMMGRWSPTIVKLYLERMGGGAGSDQSGGSSPIAVGTP
jgi:hypothetical protein